MSDDRTRSERAEPPDAGPEASGVVILNPVAGDAGHASQVRELAEQRGYDVRETESGGDAVEFAAEAAPGADLVVACGGDGTIQEVLRGVQRADALGDVTLGVVPAGTGNNFAKNIGIEDIEHAFEVLADGEARHVDVGTVSAGAEGDRDLPFLNSCVGGLTAEASAETDPEQKSRFGVLAYVMNTFQEAVAFDGIPMRVRTSEAIERQWSGTTTCILVGNGRRFFAEGRTQANMEDGMLEVTIFEGESPLDLAGDVTAERLLGDGAEGVTRLETPALEVTVEDEESANFSLDGEMLSARKLTVECHSQRLWLRVGEQYEPAPDPTTDQPSANG